MEVKRWQRKVWWLARYFELAVPMMFAFYVGCGVALMAQRRISLGFVVGALAGLIYMAALREIVEATWSWQALDWLMGIRHRLTSEEVTRLRMQAEKPELKVCRVFLLMPAMVMTALAFSWVPIWSAVSRIMLAVVVGTLILSHILMARVQLVQVYSEITKIGHSS